jgi:hypothetical protein
MIRVIFISSLLVLLILGCRKDTSVEASNNTPEWLEAKISLMSNDTTNYYVLTKLYRYSWNGIFLYYFYIPSSSCMYCDLYDQNGNKVQITDDAMLQDFLKNRKDEVLIWEWKK